METLRSELPLTKVSGFLFHRQDSPYGFPKGGGPISTGVNSGRSDRTVSLKELRNKKAYFDYFVEDEYTAGIVLVGGEIKSIRNGNVSMSDSFCYLSSENEMILKNSYIKLYENAGMVKYDERRERKLLLHKEESRKIRRFMKEKGKGYTIVPLSMFFNERGKCKLKIGICKGKKNYDKRETIKERDIDRQAKKEIE